MAEIEFMKCPQCHAEATKVGAFWICPTHGQLQEAKPVAPLRIFLSYGHDANEELVRRIYADLKQRGHDVWFDKTDIKAGDDWRRSITSGITECDRFFSFLSKHSIRESSVCLDEIRIAIGAKGGNIQSILVECEQEVKLPPSISHIQWLDMHDWKEHGKIGEAAWDKWYQEKLAEIIRVVESDESRKFAGEIRALEEYLKPVVSDFAADARIQKLLEKKLTGRAWLFDAVEKWRTTPKSGPSGSDSRIFWMMGAPGFGKSFFAAHLAHFYGRGTVIGVHFCAYDKPDHRSAPRIIRTLAFQLATRLPDYRKLLLTLPEIAELDRKQTAAELFDYLLANPLKLSITGGRERLLIVIDALDEAGSASAQGGDGRNELVEMLARHAPSLPDWIGLVVTSRPESDVRAPLQGLNPFVLDTATEANLTDLREYLRQELAPQLQHRPDADRLVEQILEKSEGVFLYAERFCDDVQQNHLSLDRPEQFPQGLGGIFFQWFQRQFPDPEKFRKQVRPALRAILAAREPLPVEILQRLFNWQDEEIRDFTRPLGSLFPIVKEARRVVVKRIQKSLNSQHLLDDVRDASSPLGLLFPVDSGTAPEVIKPFHKAVIDWLADESKAGAYFVSIIEGHRMLARSYGDWWSSDATALSEIIYHLAEAKLFETAAVLLFKDEFLKLKQKTFGPDAVSADFVCAEKNSNGYFGLAGPAWHLFQFAEKEFNAIIHKAAAEGGGPSMARYLSGRREMFEKACLLSKDWLKSGSSVRRCAQFGREALLLFADDLPLVVKAADVLQQLSEYSCQSGRFDAVRVELEKALAEVKKTPRVRAGYGSAMVDSAFEILNYEENALSSALAALHLRPLRTVADIWLARRFKAIADCDTDPWDAIGIAVRDAEEALEAKLERSIQSLLIP